MSFFSQTFLASFQELGRNPFLLDKPDDKFRIQENIARTDCFGV